jgi:hypothetical protein
METTMNNEFDLAMETFKLMSDRLNFDERIVEEITNLQIMIRSNRETYINNMNKIDGRITELKSEIIAMKEVIDRIRFLLRDIATI